MKTRFQFHITNVTPSQTHILMLKITTQVLEVRIDDWCSCAVMFLFQIVCLCVCVCACERFFRRLYP